MFVGVEAAEENVCGSGCSVGGGGSAMGAILVLFFLFGWVEYED